MVLPELCHLTSDVKIIDVSWSQFIVNNLDLQNISKNDHSIRSISYSCLKTKIDVTVQDFSFETVKRNCSFVENGTYPVYFIASFHQYSNVPILS